MKSLVKTTVVVAALLGASATSYAAVFNGTAAGTKITNTARATYDGGDSVSASAELTVQEVIDVSLSVADPDVAVEAGDTNEQLVYTVQNTGNGTESFKVSYTTSGDFTPAGIQMFVDANDNGTLDAGEVLVTGGTITLNKDESAKIIIQGNIPSDRSENDEAGFSLTVASDTAGAADASAGTQLNGLGTGGAADAIVGDSPKQIIASKFVVGASVQAVTISKAVTGSVDPFGNASFVPGTIVTYNITVVVDTTNGNVANLVITDDLPAELSYDLTNNQKGSVAVNGVGQTNADDATDGTKVEGNTVTVDLGTVTSNQTFTIVITAEIK